MRKQLLEGWCAMSGPKLWWEDDVLQIIITSKVRNWSHLAAKRDVRKNILRKTGIHNELSCHMLCDKQDNSSAILNHLAMIPLIFYNYSRYWNFIKSGVADMGYFVFTGNLVNLLNATLQPGSKQRAKSFRMT